MPSSHLPRAPCDKFVCDIPCGLWGIVGGYGLQLRHVCVQIVYKHRAISWTGPSGAGRGNSVQRLRRGCMDIIAISVHLLYSLHSHHTENLRVRARATSWLLRRIAHLSCHDGSDRPAAPESSTLRDSLLVGVPWYDPITVPHAVNTGSTSLYFLSTSSNYTKEEEESFMFVIMFIIIKNHQFLMPMYSFGKWWKWKRFSNGFCL